MRNTKLYTLPLSLLFTLQSSLSLALTNPVSKSPLFAADTLVQLEIKSDFVKIRKAADGGFMEQVEGKKDPKYYAPMALKDLANPNRTFSGQDRARGNSSLTEGEAQFPKLKIEIADSEDLKGTLFEGAKNFRINTHVNTNPKAKYTPMGRLNSEAVPWRENLAYQLAQTLGLPTPATRLARIHYIDVGSKKDFTRNAMLIETDKKIGERLGAQQIDLATFSQDEKTGLDPLAAAIYLAFHKLIGNDDVALRVNEPTVAANNDRYRPLFNAMIFEYPNKKRIPVVYDLDFSTFVTGFEQIQKNLYVNKNFKLLTHEESLFATRFSLLRQKLPQDALAKAIAFIKSRKDALYQTVKTASVDEDGRKNAQKHLDVFFSMVDTVMGYNVIAEEGVQFYTDTKKSDNLLLEDAVEGEAGTLRPGTPVMVLGQENGMLKIAIIDGNFYLKDFNKNVGYIEANTKISNVMPDKLTGLVDNRDILAPGGF